MECVCRLNCGTRTIVLRTHLSPCSRSVAMSTSRSRQPFSVRWNWCVGMVSKNSCAKRKVKPSSCGRDQRCLYQLHDRLWIPVPLRYVSSEVRSFSDKSGAAPQPRVANCFPLRMRESMCACVRVRARACVCVCEVVIAVQDPRTPPPPDSLIRYVPCLRAGLASTK